MGEKEITPNPATGALLTPAPGGTAGSGGSSVTAPGGSAGSGATAPGDEEGSTTGPSPSGLSTQTHYPDGRDTYEFDDGYKMQWFPDDPVDPQGKGDWQLTAPDGTWAQWDGDRNMWMGPGDDETGSKMPDTWGGGHIPNAV